jgi:hypothetical protein
LLGPVERTVCPLDQRRQRTIGSPAGGDFIHTENR